MKESVTKFDLMDAFKALEEIEYPEVKGGIKARKDDYKPLHENLAKRATRTDILIEDYYDVDNQGDLEAAADNREAEVAKAKLARIEKIVDLDADSEEDLLTSYTGKVIIQCPQCMTLFYKNEEDLSQDEENPEVVNINETCQHCGNNSGYMVIGKVAPVEEELDNFEDENIKDTKEDEFNLDFEDEESEEEPVKEDEEDLDLDLDLEDEEEANESLNISKTAKSDNESENNSDKLTLNEAVEDEAEDEEEAKEDNEEVEAKLIPAEDVVEIIAETAEEIKEVVEADDDQVEAIDEVVEEKKEEILPEVEEVEEEAEEEEITDEALIKNSPLNINIDAHEFGGQGNDVSVLSHNKMLGGLDEDKCCEKCGKNPCECDKLEEATSAEVTLKKFVDSLDECGNKPAKKFVAGIKEAVEIKVLVDEVPDEETCEGGICVEPVCIDDVCEEPAVEEPVEAEEIAEVEPAVEEPVIDEIPVEKEAEEKVKEALNEESINKADIEELFNSKEFKKPVSEAEVEAAFEEDFTVAEELDDKSLNENISKYFTAVYENVTNFVAESCELTEDKLIVEGIINFNSGATKATRFTFTQKGNSLVGNNKSITTNEAFTLDFKVKDKVLITENFKYSYSIDENLIEGYTRK